MKLSQFRTLIREEVKRALREAKTPVSGKKIDDFDLVDKGYLGKYDDEWLELFSDELADPTSPTAKKRFLAKANKFLQLKKFTWQVKDIVSQNEDGEITWVVA
jgi:hypothetical protein